MHNYKKLNVWWKARRLVKEIYLVSARFPQAEKFGITSQIRRAVISISNNIAEGCGRTTTKDFKRFLDMSYGSALEVENLLYLTYDLEYLKKNELGILQEKVQEIQKMIFGLISKI